MFANEAKESVINDTPREMLCFATYPSVYEDQIIDGVKKLVEIEPKEEKIAILQPGNALEKTRPGVLKCYNELAKISSFDKNNFTRTNTQTLEAHVIAHEKYDLTQYEGKDKEFVENKFGAALRCAAYNKGEYCNQGIGLDIIYDKNSKVQTILLHGPTINSGELPFEPESILKLRTNTDPLGLWVQKNYHRLFAKETSRHTHNLIMWEYLSKHIFRVIMIPEKGFFKLSHTKKDGKNLFSNGWEESPTAQQYIQAIEVQYK
jgi:hypothetical protein